MWIQSSYIAAMICYLIIRATTTYISDVMFIIRQLYLYDNSVNLVTVSLVRLAFWYLFLCLCIIVHSYLSRMWSKLIKGSYIRPANFVTSLPLWVCLYLKHLVTESLFSCLPLPLYSLTLFQTGCKKAAISEQPTL